MVSAIVFLILNRCLPCATAGVGASDCGGCPLGKAGVCVTACSTSSECKLCVSGQFSIGGIEEKCKSCPLGSYGDRIVPFRCDDCKPGYWSNLIEASSEDACKECIPGKYNNDPASKVIEACKACNKGRYSLVAAGRFNLFLVPNTAAIY